MVVVVKRSEKGLCKTISVVVVVVVEVWYSVVSLVAVAVVVGGW